MSKKKKLNNPFMEMSDEEFEHFLSHAGHLQPKWKECSKEEYERHVKEPPEDASLYDKMLFALTSTNDYRKEPIYKHSGIFYEVVSGKKNEIIGYKYYKHVGSERVFICNSTMADWIHERKKLLNSPSNLNR